MSRITDYNFFSQVVPGLGSKSAAIEASADVVSADGNSSERLAALFIYKTDETGKSIAD